MSSLYKTCLHKKRFHTLKYVKDAVKIQKEKYGNDVHYYICPYCGAYHLTSKQTKEEFIEKIKQVK